MDYAKVNMSALFSKSSSSEIVLLYVDDMIITMSDPQGILSMKHYLQQALK